MEPEKSILKEFLNGGWLVPLVGAAAMFARLLSGDSGLSAKQQFKRIFGWSVGPRETGYANQMTWSHWEDRVEEVLTPIIIAAAKEQGVK